MHQQNLPQYGKVIHSLENRYKFKAINDIYKDYLKICLNFHIFVTPHCQYRSPSFSGTASRQKPLYPQTGLRISLWKFQKTLPIHKPVKIGLKEAVLDDAIFLEF